MLNPKKTLDQWEIKVTNLKHLLSKSIEREEELDAEFGRLETKLYEERNRADTLAEALEKLLPWLPINSEFAESALAAHRQAREESDSLRDVEKIHELKQEISDLKRQLEERDNDLTTAYMAGFHKRDDEVRDLKCKLKNSDTALDQVMQARDFREDQIQRIHVALGGDGEWVRRIPDEPPPRSGDLGEDSVSLAEDLREQLHQERAHADALAGALSKLVEPCECYGRDRGKHGILCQNALTALNEHRQSREKGNESEL